MSIIGTTLNPHDGTTGSGSTNVPSLSNANLTVEGTSGSGNYIAVRTISGIQTGKYYFEASVNAQGSNNNGGAELGLFEQGASLTQSGGTTGGMCWANNGTTQVNGSGTATIAAWRTGTPVLGIAVAWQDIVFGSQVWGRVGSAGLWNNAAGNGPVTGLNGISLSALSGILKPWYFNNPFSGTPTQVTFNFGATAFNGSVPVGYTAGIPAGGAVEGMIFNTQF